MKRQRVMLGNGINRCVLSNISWGDLLADIAQVHEIDLNPNISFPMQFENIINQILAKENNPSDNVYAEIKKHIIDRLRGATLSDNTPHRLLAQEAATIITTNYDYLIEGSLDDCFSSAKIPFTSKDTNNKYNINNYITVANKKIYHIHGDLRQAKSICLGYEHYAGTLQHLRDTIATKKDIGKEKKPAIILALEKEDYKLNSWAKIFFTDDIHIVGLGLTQSEIDIWWLITYRAFLYYSNRFGVRRLISNTIIYHDVATERDTNMEYALNNCHIQYQFHKIDKKENSDYYATYVKIAEELRKNSTQNQ